MTMHCRAKFSLSLVAVFALAGCGGDGTGPVDGTVTFDGQPVANGSITLIGEGNNIREGAVIKDGAFKTQLPPGKYKLELYGQKVVGKRKQKGMSGEIEELDITEELFSEQFNTKSTLTEEVKSGQNTLKLDLKSK